MLKKHIYKSLIFDLIKTIIIAFYYYTIHMGNIEIHLYEELATNQLNPEIQFYKHIKINMEFKKKYREIYMS